MGKASFEPIGWALLRAPLLPADAGGQPVTRGDVRLALQIASESLAAELERSAAFPAGRRAIRRQERRDRALWQYLNRMRYRPTPFGLSAGVSLISWGPATDVSLTSGSLCPRARPDMGRVGELVARLEADEQIRRQLRWVANPAAVEQDGRLYLSEQAAGPLPRSGVSVRATPAALAVLAQATRPASYQDLVGTVLHRPAATPALAERLVDQLCRESFLLCELWTVVYGPDPLGCLIEALERPEVAAAAGSALRDLRRLRDDLAAFGTDPGPASYRIAVASADRTKPASESTSPPHEDYALQVDGRWELAGTRLHHGVAAAAAEAAELLLRFGTMADGPGDLAAWRQAFLHSYGPNTFVSLPVALDRRLGIGPPDRGRPDGPRAPREALSRRDALLHRVAIDALRDQRTVIELDDATVAGLTIWEPGGGPPPDDLDIVVAVAAGSAAAVDHGDFTCVVSPIVGAYGAGKLTGRFADLFGPAADTALASLGGSEQGRAEVVFRPVRDRLLNVTLRSNPASWVIPVGVPPPPDMNGRVLLPKDLLVGVAEGRLCLLDRQGRNVTPVATHMLNHSRAPELARFLLDIPRDGRPILTGFWWGSASALPVLPRLQRGRIVLSPARWLCDCSQVRTEKDLDEWRARWNPPASCYLSEADNRLLIDLDDPGDRKHLLDSFVRRRRWLRLDEAVPGPGDAWLPGPDGPRLMELAVPLRARTAAARPSAAASRQYRPWTRLDRDAITRPPGSEWLFVKVYLPRDEIDAVLADAVTPLLARIDDANMADEWFFIRYADPGTHLRLRWRQRTGAGPALTALVLPWAHDLHRTGRISRIVLDTYEREVARYGGAAAMNLAEKIFAADSRFVLGLLRLRATGTLIGDGQPAADDTEVAVLTLDRLLADLGVEAGRRPGFCAAIAAAGPEAGRGYRKRQKRLRELLGGANSHPQLDDLLAARSAIVTATAADLRHMTSPLTQPLDAIQRSIAHMHLNRLLYPTQQQEQLVYGLAERATRSLLEAPIVLRVMSDHDLVLALLTYGGYEDADADVDWDVLAGAVVGEDEDAGGDVDAGAGVEADADADGDADVLADADGLGGRDVCTDGDGDALAG